MSANGPAKRANESSEEAARPEARPGEALATVAGADVAAANEPLGKGEGGKAAGAKAVDDGAAANNLVKRSVDEICALMGDVHEIREELLAHGVRFHMLNAMIELGVHDKPDELAKMAETAVEASVKAHGLQAIKPEELDRHIDEIVTLEKSLRHVRQVAAGQGVHMQALNHLTQLMRLNPGDGGVQAINTFVAYADAAGVPLERVAELREEIAEESESVLPNIPREGAATRGAVLRARLTDLAVGTVLTVGVMWLVL